ncbi:MAG: hypothetical protein R3335_10295 [Anaerolineales bacterium]|nr:hypothetical protein [Anaerolineales bacterium]
MRYFYQGEWHQEPAFKLGILGAADFSWADTLRGPQKSIPDNVRFFFTEKGWREVGRHVVAECKRQGQEVRVIAVKENSVNVVWGDDYEVAAQPKKPRSKKDKWYY